MYLFRYDFLSLCICFVRLVLLSSLCMFFFLYADICFVIEFFVSRFISLGVFFMFCRYFSISSMYVYVLFYVVDSFVRPFVRFPFVISLFLPFVISLFRSFGSFVLA